MSRFVPDSRRPVSLFSLGHFAAGRKLNSLHLSRREHCALNNKIVFPYEIIILRSIQVDGHFVCCCRVCEWLPYRGRKRNEKDPKTVCKVHNHHLHKNYVLDYFWDGLPTEIASHRAHTQKPPPLPPPREPKNKSKIIEGSIPMIKANCIATVFV